MTVISLITISLLLTSPVSGNEYVLADDINYQGSVDILPSNHYGFGGFDGQYDGMYGTFEVTSGTDITFFILTPSDWDKFHNEGRDDITKLQLAEDVSSGIINFRLPQMAIWYYVFDNSDDATNTQHVTYEIYKDQTPPEIDLNLVAGGTYSGTTQITVTATDANFDISSVILYIDDVQEESEVGIGVLSFDWDTTAYTDSQHTIKVVAKDNVKSGDGTVGNTAELEITVNVDNVNPTSSATTTDTTTSGTTTSEVPLDLSGLSLPLLVLGVSGIAVGSIVYLRKRTQSKVSDGVRPDAKVLIICPYCGARNEQGVLKCHNCDADI